MTGTINLRLAADGDAAVVAAVFSASRRLLAFLPELHSVAEDRRFIRDGIMPHYRVTVAETGGGIVGYIADRPGWIEQLYVAPRALRAGIGSALLADAKARNAALELWCFADNMPARAFYERLGGPD